MINLEKEIRQQPSVLASLKSYNDSTLKALVKEIKEKDIKNIYFAARGTSDHACVYAQYLFGIVLGIPCTLGTPSIFTQYGTDINFDKTLVVGVSQSGRAEDVNYVLKSANNHGRPVRPPVPASPAGPVPFPPWPALPTAAARSGSGYPRRTAPAYIGMRTGKTGAFHTVVSYDSPFCMLSFRPKRVEVSSSPVVILSGAKRSRRISPAVAAILNSEF